MKKAFLRAGQDRDRWQGIACCRGETCLARAAQVPPLQSIAISARKRNTGVQLDCAAILAQPIQVDTAEPGVRTPASQCGSQSVRRLHVSPNATLRATLCLAVPLLGGLGLNRPGGLFNRRIEISRARYRLERVASSLTRHARGESRTCSEKLLPPKDDTTRFVCRRRSPRPA